MLLLVLLICSSVLALTSGVGLHFELTHVDAKEGRYTTTERARRAVDRSRRRLAAFMSSAGHGDVRAPVQRAQGEYFTEYLIGDPPQRAEAIVDTGSNLVWTQCTDCLAAVADRCFEQHLPLYNYSASRSAKPVQCTDALCQANQYGHFCDRDGSCVFLDEFGSGTIAGHLGTEVFAFQSGAADLAFGCVKASSIDPGSLVGTSGLIGLGRGRLSLVSQTGAGKFSYCLTPYDSDGKAASHLFVGASANLAGESPVVSIKFVKNPTDPPYNGVYFLPLVGLTVGETKLPIPSSLFDLRQVGAGNWSGGVFIDSGSTITSLVDGAYKALVDELTKQIGGSFVRPPPARGWLRASRVATSRRRRRGWCSTSVAARTWRCRR